MISRANVAAASALAAICALPSCTTPAPSFIDRPAGDLLRAGVAALQRGETERAESLLERALTEAVASQDLQAEVAARRNLALAAERRGDLVRAEQVYAEAQVAARGAGDLNGEFDCALAVARLALDRGDAAAAEVGVTDARVTALAIGTVSARGSYLTLRASLLELQGALVEAESAAREAVRLFDMQGSSLDQILGHARARFALASALRARGESIAAIAEFRRTAMLSKEVADHLLLARSREAIASLLADAGHTDDACLWLEDAVASRLVLRDRKGALADLDRLISLAGAAGSLERVDAYKARAHELAESQVP